MDRKEHRVPMPAFGETIRYHRRRLGLTQEELAARTGLSTRSIGKIEAGRVGGSRPVTVRLLADAFGLTGTERESFFRSATGGQNDLPVPAQLPTDVRMFTGRGAELADLDRLLAPADRPAAVTISAVSGTAGIGKTALATHWAHRIAHHFPDGHLFIDLHGYSDAAAAVEPAAALERLLRALGVPGERIPAGLDDRAALWRSVAAGRRLLLVLDNAATTAQVRPLLPGTPGCLVVVTSRRDLTSLEPTYGVRLDTLPDLDAVTLFTRTAGPDSGEPAELVAEVVELCGRLPLAIRIAAARLRAHPSWRLSDLAGRLRDHGQRLAELADTDGSRSVTGALDLSYQQLTTDQQRMYRLLGMHPGPHIEQYAAAALAGTEPDLAGQLLDQLLDANLLHEPAPGRYELHDLVRSHAHETAGRDEPETECRAAVHRMLDYYRHAARVATNTLYPHLRRNPIRLPATTADAPDLSSADAAGTWLDAELPNLIAAIAHAADHSWAELAVQLVAIIYIHLVVRSRYHDAQVLHYRSLSVARKSGNRIAEMYSLNCLAWLGIQRCDYRQTADAYRQAEEIAATLGNAAGEMNAAIGIGDMLMRQGRYGQAFANVERALEIAVAGGRRVAEVWIRNVLGQLYLVDGEPALAREQYRHSLAIAEGLHDRVGQMYAQVGLGHVEKRMGRFRTARAHYRRALAVAETTGKSETPVYPLLGLGDADRRQSRPQAAARHYERALDIAQQTDNHVGRLETLHALGRLHHATGRPEAALTHHQQALALATRIGHRADQALIHDGIAHAYVALDQPEPARQHWQAGLDILTSLGTEHTPDQDVTATSIRANLADVPTHPAG